MANETLKTMIIGFGLFLAFSTLMVTMVVNFGNYYSQNTSEIYAGALDQDDFDTAINDYRTDSNESYERMYGADVENTDSAIGIFSIITDIGKMITTPFRLLGNLMSNMGVPSILLTVIIAGLGVTLLFAIWRVIKQG